MEPPIYADARSRSRRLPAFVGRRKAVQTKKPRHAAKLPGLLREELFSSRLAALLGICQRKRPPRCGTTGTVSLWKEGFTVAYESIDEARLPTEKESPGNKPGPPAKGLCQVFSPHRHLARAT
jgi:hypothetical protein